VSDPKRPEPGEDLLEFLGGIDEVNEDAKDDDFSDFLANTDLDNVAAKPIPPAKEKNE
jgi:hypothetical protein